MEKLGNIFKGNSIVVTQSPHGALQKGRSMDFITYEGGWDLIAPIKGRVERLYGSGSQAGFHFVFSAGNDRYDILFHHCKAKAIGEYTKGAVIGSWNTGTGSHVHTAIQVNGEWITLLDYINRSVQLLPTRGKPENKWTNWNTYWDRYLIYNNNEMVIYQ